ncbi:aspartate/glutamate racemase family protein [Nesterenkonia muleiensis]|uniref:aspartate/glutamate racemase family protein n=1 Tax=Nesterenkonia muleiensis TaxID=2282648 RepID=UPI000E70CF5E|nr:aspartate/glutamate racemase family protein [Nesterenkonia muleiensis]
MMYGNRDWGVTRITARPGKYAYGMGLGIMLVDEVYPGFPGDVRNASAYPFPIQYDIAAGVDIQQLVYAEDKSACLEPILAAARRLERMGVRAIAAECGYFAYFQREVAAHVEVPVFMSSLLQVPLAQQIIGPQKKVGVICASREQLTDTHLHSVGIEDEDRVALIGNREDHPIEEFANLWLSDQRPELPTADYSIAEREFLTLCRKAIERHPDIGALVFECTGFQPFARAVQRELDLPLFSWSTLLDYAYSVVNHREHYGHV